MIRILAVEDEIPIAELLRLSLRQAGYTCVCAYDGIQAADLIEIETFDLILLDIMLPGIDGFELMEYIRVTGTPVIFLTAKNTVADRIRGLRLGAEDYIVKPFDVLELLTRVESVLQRHGKLQTILQVGDLQFNTRARKVFQAGQELPLTRKEYELALLFAQNQGVILTKNAIYERIWGGAFPESTRTVELHVQRMKKKMGWEERLRSVYGVGYRLEVQE